MKIRLIRNAAIFFALTVATLTAFVGCAGSGTDSASNPLLARYEAFLAAWAAENLDAVMANFSLAYLDDCETYDDIEEKAQAIFDDPDVSITFSNLTVTSSQITGDFGLLVGTITTTFTGPGGTDIETEEIEIRFRRESGVWLVYGDQLCTD